LGEVEEGDVAQGIVAAWRLGVIDVRRVFFCCDSDDSEEEDVSGFVWDEGFGNGQADCREEPPFIVISDDEAVEDNRIADAGGGRGIGRNIGRGSRKAGGRRRQAPGTGLTPAAAAVQQQQQQPRGIRAVMGEFAVFDSSSSDTDIGSKRPPLPIWQYAPKKRREFARWLSRWQQLPRLPKLGRQAQARRPLAAKPVASDFVFDEALVDDTPSPRAHQHQHRLQRRLQHQHQHRMRQTRLFPAPATRTLDAVADHIGKRQASGNSTAKPASARPAFSRPMRSGNGGSGGRLVQRKAAQPTRVQVQAQAQAQRPPPQLQNSGGSGDAADEELVLGVEPGTRFRSDTWIGQGGLRRMRRLLEGHLPPAGDSSADDHFSHNDVLRISSSAAPGEFIQALSMLCQLWLGQAPSAPAVLRWMDFAQRLVLRYTHDAEALGAVAGAAVGCAHRLLAGPDTSATVALMLGVLLMQAACGMAVWRGRELRLRNARAAAADGLGAWPAERLAREIDSCVLAAAAAALGHGGPLPPPQQQQLDEAGVALLHALATAAAAVPLAPIEASVLRASAVAQPPGHWRALGRLASWAQVNADGIAAPRPSAHWHPALASVAASAVAHALEPTPGARPSDAAVRQAFVRIHRLVVGLGVRPAPGARLHVL
ncbi:hypothetical protein LPJ66_011262, partial [Kickxella alabastrina]